MFISYISRDIREPCRQRGSALIIALVFLLAMTLIGVAGMQSTTQQEGMAGNLRDRNLAFQAAEAALLDAENALNQDRPGIVRLDPATFTPPANWMNYPWGAQSTIYPGALTEISAPPRYVIEDLGWVTQSSGAGESVKVSGSTGLGDQYYRITARSLGGTTDAIVILQTVYRR